MPRIPKLTFKQDVEKNTIEFIQDYRKYTNLWDPTHEWYTNKKKRLDTMTALGKKYNLDSEAVKSKIKSLRSYYIKERRRMINRSLDEDKIYKPNWFAFEEMSFLSDIVGKRDEMMDVSKIEVNIIFLVKYTCSILSSGKMFLFSVRKC